MKFSFNQIVLALTSAAVVSSAIVLAYWAGAGPSGSQPGAGFNSPTIQRLLHADSSSGGKSMSLATGRVDAEFEGLYLLDHKTGNLYCVIISPRSGREVATYQANVFVGMNLNNVADTDLVMTTGYIDLTQGGRAGQLRPGSCLVYVAEGNSGKAVAYGLQYSPQAVEQSVPQGGPLALIWSGAVRAPQFGVAPAQNAAPAAPAGGNAAGGNAGGGN